MFVGTSKGVIALNQATGAEQWTFTDDLETPIPTFVFIDPAFASTKTIFITGRSVRNETGSVTAINGATGQVLWNANTHNNPDLAVAGGLIVGGASLRSPCCAVMCCAYVLGTDRSQGSLAGGRSALPLRSQASTR